VAAMKLRWLVLGVLVAALLVPAALLTAARLLDLPGLRWVQLVAFAPYAVPLYLLALVLLLVAWGRGRGAWRAGAGVLAVVALLGAAVHAAWASGPFVGTAAKESANRTPVHVMTANLLVGGADTARVVELAVRHEVDVLVLQEVTPQALAGLKAAGVDQVFGYTAGKAQPGVVGTMVFSRTRLSGVRRLGTGFASYAMDVRLGGAGQGGAGRVHLLAVHPRPPTQSALAWRDDQRVVRRAAASLSGSTLVAGDLNATMDHAPLRDLAGRGFEDAATAANAGFQPTWPSSGMVSRFGVAVPSVVAIDHVLTRGGLHAVHTEAVQVPGTDHRALVVTLSP
jgi:endonuclease/exonuclease/phosphatase (EEP) superfamily protein YafD